MQSIHIHQHSKLQSWSNKEWQLVLPTLTTQPTLSTNHHLINLRALSQTMKLLKLPHCSAVLLSTQLLLVLHPNNQNVTFILITKIFFNPSSFYILLSKTIMKCSYLCVIFNTKCNVWCLCVTIQFKFRYTINTPWNTWNTWNRK